ncbi:MAG: family N-acetyltransferase [Bacillales bacterium]|jgi:ribosomal protein S18 acetylase RimI-like enzyme|nr:family N-acetyltransferase [Bacillales bacterium]
MGVRLIEIPKIDRVKYLDYLLMADESPQIVNEYINDGELFAVTLDNKEIGVIQFVFLNEVTVELKNIAIKDEYRGKGFGREVIQLAFNYYQNKNYYKIIVGTANSSITNILIYQKLGFRIVGVRKDFFLKYPEPIFENGIRAIDMIIFEKEL